MEDEEEIPGIPGNFEPESLLMWQLELLTTEVLAKKWWKEYLEYHKGVDQGVKYCIGYFADEKHRNNLKNWLN